MSRRTDRSRTPDRLVASRTGRHRATPVLGLVLAIGLTGGTGGLTGCGRTPAPDKAFTAFAAGLAKGDLTGVRVISPAGQPLAADVVKGQLTALEGDLAGRQPTVKPAGRPKVAKGQASVPLNVSWPVAEKVTWSYQTSVSGRLKDGAWQVYLSPATIHPDLHDGDRFTVRRTAAPRGSILDGTGNVIVSNRPVVTVGVQPNQVLDLTTLLKTLGAAFTSVGVSIDLADVPGRVKAAAPTAFVDVVTLRREAYDQIRDQIHDLPGTVFRESAMPLAPSRVFARALLGGVGEVTKEIMDKNPGRYQVGDTVGLSGLQQRYDDTLRGVPGVTVVIPGRNNEADRILFQAEPQPGKGIKTSLDVKTQNAADGALADQTRRSALVAIRISDGAVLAVANGPGGGELDLALTAAVPPGSTFKTVTAYAVLDNGSVTVDTPVACPKTLTVEGRTFKNSHDFELGTVPFHVDFAKSCNTAFASLAPKLGDDGLAKAATNLGIGVPWDLGIDAYTGKVSSGGGAPERAAAAFGQGTTQVSPIALAAAAAAVARGQWKQPALVLDPAPDKPAAAGPGLKPEVVVALKQMMREVVTDGTATGVKGVPGAPIHGKTGTAEYDNDPAHTHSWFIGFRGDIAFAVFVENGGLSTDTAVPLAGKFFTALG